MENGKLEEIKSSDEKQNDALFDMWLQLLEDMLECEMLCYEIFGTSYDKIDEDLVMGLLDNLNERWEVTGRKQTKRFRKVTRDWLHMLNSGGRLN